MRCGASGGKFSYFSGPGRAQDVHTCVSSLHGTELVLVAEMEMSWIPRSDFQGSAGWEGISARDGVKEGGNRSLISNASSGIWLVASAGGLRSKAWCNSLLPARDKSLFINV